MAKSMDDTIRRLKEEKEQEVNGWLSLTEKCLLNFGNAFSQGEVDAMTYSRLTVAFDELLSSYEGWLSYKTAMEINDDED